MKTLAPKPEIVAESSSEWSPLRMIEWLVFVLAGAPTLAGAVLGLGFVLDDYEFLDRFRFEGLGGFADEVSYRPLQGAYHGLTFAALGDRPWLHFILLAVFQGAVGVMLWRLLRQHLRGDVANASIVVWLLLANRSSIRFWISTGPNSLAMIFLLLAAREVSASGERSHRLARATILALLALITYEGAAPLAVAVVIWVAWNRRHPVRMFLSLVLPGLLLGGAALWMVLASPRGTHSPSMDEMATGVMAHMASYMPMIFPRGRAGAVVVLVGLIVGFLLIRDIRRRDIVAGVGFGGLVIALGLIPFVAMSFPVGYPGVLDRGNYFASLGGSVVIGSLAVAARIRLPDRSGAGRLMVAIVALMALVTNGRGLTDYRMAAADARLVTEMVLEAHSGDADAPILVSRLPFHNGVSGWSYQVQLTAALRLETGDHDPTRWATLNTKSEEAAPGQILVTLDGR